MEAAETATRRLLADLFPFHLIADLTARPTVERAGASLIHWLGFDPVGHLLDDVVTITRPLLPRIDGPTLRQNASAVFVASVDGTRQLKGQIVELEPDVFALAASPVVTAGTSLDDLGLTLTHFAPHDSAPDLLMMSRFSELQLLDLERQASELGTAREERDTYNEWAFTDQLTGLANRRAFWDLCPAALDRPPDAEHPGAAVMVYIDVDSFKAINDGHGHLVGDEVLRVIADRIQRSVRPGDVAARLGGDEFALLLCDIDTPDAPAVVDRIRSSLVAPIPTDDGMLAVSVSIGARIVPAGTPMDDVIRDSDTAMYQGRAEAEANGASSGGVTWFEPAMGADRQQRRVLTGDLERAVAHGGLTTVFQPIVDLPDGRLRRFEVLARWDHPDLGPIRPDRFVDLAERAGFVADLDHWVLTNALAQLKRWHEVSPDVGLQANLSGRSLDPDLPRRVGEALDSSGVDPGALTLEITEHCIIDGARIAPILGALVDLGVALHLDDFGTGYSSLTHLHGLPVDGLKIDRSFVSGATENDRTLRLVVATVTMARSLGIEVVAEGVETEEAARVMWEAGCQLGQGYLWSTPLSAVDATRWVERSVSAPRRAAASESG